MSPFIYYNHTATETEPIRLIYNENSYFIDESKGFDKNATRNFLYNNVMWGNYSDSDGWNLNQSIPIETNVGEADLLNEIAQLDNYTFNDMKKTGNVYFSQFYVN